MSQMLNVDQALEAILAKIDPHQSTLIPLEQSAGRVLAQNIIAETDLPPFANSSVDGFAVHTNDLKTLPTTLHVVEDIPAGYASTHLLEAGQAARIMTGAPIPAGANAVIPVEDTDADWHANTALTPQTQVQILKPAHPTANIRPAGENVRQGATVLRDGTRLRPQDIGILAALGIQRVMVYERPKVVVLSTGDELVPLDAPLTLGKIHDSNSYTIGALISQYHAEPILLPAVPDQIEQVRALFLEALAHEPQMIISTAGVSVGIYDVVRTVLEELGEVNFWRVNIKPGKPLAFGILQGVPFFGLPGNPVSAMVTFDVFVRPALLKMIGLPNEFASAYATLDETIHTDGRRTYLRVKLSKVQGELIATSLENQSSGALMSMVLADGLLIIPEDVQSVEGGTRLPVRLLRELAF